MPSPAATGRVTSPYGPRKAEPELGIGPFHYGEDRNGSGVFSPVTGTVVFAAYSAIFGWTVGVREAAAPTVIWWMSHMNSLSVSVGQAVAERQSLVGPIGDSGRAYGVHVHTERREGGAASIQSGRSTNPADYYSSSPAGSGGTPITGRQHPGMYLLRTLDGSIYLATDNGMIGISALAHVTLLQRMFGSYPNYDTFNELERQTIAGYIAAASTADDGETAKILAALSKIQIDPAPIVKAVGDAITAAGVQVDEAAIAAAVTASLAPQFAGIPDAVADEQHARQAE